MSKAEEDDEEDTLLEDELTLELEEEGEYIPPGYLAAEGPYKHFCACENYETCDFCKWFSLIKECAVHGRGTRRPFRSCVCHAEALAKTWSSKHGEKAAARTKDDRKVPCTCAKRRLDQEESCTCLEDVKSDTSDDPLPHWGYGKFRSVEEAMYEYETEGETHLQGENEWVSPEVEREDVWDENEDEIMKIGLESTEKVRTLPSELKNLIHEEDPGEAGDPQPCTCGEIPPSRSGSTTEIDTSGTEASEPSSTYSALTLGETVDDTSSDPGSSEASSVDAVEMDPTRVKWTTAASDDSVDDSSSDDAGRPEPIDFSVRRIQRRREQPTKKTNSVGRLHQYLVLQKSHPKNYLEICKSKKDQVKSYSCTLMDLNSIK